MRAVVVLARSERQAIAGCDGLAVRTPAGSWAAADAWDRCDGWGGIHARSIRIATPRNPVFANGKSALLFCSRTEQEHPAGAMRT